MEVSETVYSLMKWTSLMTTGRFSLTLTSRSNRRPVEDIVISIYLGSGATSVSATATGDRRPLGMGGGALGAGVKRDESAAEGYQGGGSWDFDPLTQVQNHAKVTRLS